MAGFKGLKPGVLTVLPYEPIQAWQRQFGEPAKAYHAFTHFRDMRNRTCSGAYRTHRTECDHKPLKSSAEVAPKHWREWSRHYAWVERAIQWDEEIDRQTREQLAHAQVEARERHMRLAQASLTILSQPIRAALEAAKDPKLVERLTQQALDSTQGATDLINQVAMLAKVIPAIVTMERLALGMSTESIEHERKKHDEGLVFANRIAADPVATRLAIQLLDRFAGDGQGFSLGPGTPGEPGEVADGAAPEPPDGEAG